MLDSTLHLFYIVRPILRTIALCTNVLIKIAGDNSIYIFMFLIASVAINYTQTRDKHQTNSRYKLLTSLKTIIKSKILLRS